MLAKGRLATSSHDDSAEEARWRIPREGWEKLAEQARGQVVTLNYDRATVVGKVVQAFADGVGVYVEVDLDDERSWPTPPARFGPGFVNRRSDGADVLDFDLGEVSLLGFRGTPIEDVAERLPLPEVKEVQRVALGPEDRLVISLSESFAAPDRLDAMKEQLAEVFGIGRHRVLVVLGAAALTVIGPAPPERAALEELLDTIDEMGAATNQDLATDGEVPQGEESAEGRVWARIEASAERLRRELFR